jgi:hypothetical protein
MRFFGKLQTFWTQKSAFAAKGSAIHDVPQATTAPRVLERSSGSRTVVGQNGFPERQLRSILTGVKDFSRFLHWKGEAGTLRTRYLLCLLLRRRNSVVCSGRGDPTNLTHDASRRRTRRRQQWRPRGRKGAWQWTRWRSWSIREPWSAFVLVRRRGQGSVRFSRRQPWRSRRRRRPRPRSWRCLCLPCAEQGCV